MSGLYETYEPYLSSLLSVIKAAQSDAKIFFHQTWADEQDASHVDFVRYDNKSRIQVEAPQHLKEAVNLEYFNNIPILNVTLEHLVINDYTI